MHPLRRLPLPMFPRARHKESLLAFLLGAVTSAGVLAADEPRMWLERMNQALTMRNYDGVFSHWRDGRVEMLRIVHRFQDGEITERLVSLDGSGREFIRSGREQICYFPDSKRALVEPISPQKSLMANFPSFDAASGEVYDFKEIKRTRFNRRDTRVIAVTPKD
jgi:sigma-E factor negative regulatory protein RseB